MGVAAASEAMAPSLLRLLKVDFGPKPSEGGTRAVACITVDFDVTQPSRYDDNRAGTLALCELAGRYGIPLTWAVCGMSAEADMKSYSAISDGSYGSEIGIHTYSHLDATLAGPEEFRSDIERCIQALGLSSPRTFVFPWNREAHFDVLRSLGFRAYRGKRRAVGAPVMNQGLWNVRPVYYVDQKSKGAESLMKRYVDLCIQFSTPFHLWTHPWALAIGGSTTEMTKSMESLFAYLVQKRDQRLLETSTLGNIATTLDGSRLEPLPSVPRAS